MIDDFIIDQLVRSAVKKDRSPVAARTATELLSVLGKRKGPERMLDWMFRTGRYGDGFGKNPDGLSLDRLEMNPHGIDLGPIKMSIPEAIRTPSGKIELAPLQLVEDVKRLETSMNGKQNDLVLIGRRNIRSCNSWLHNLPSLLTGDNRCTLLVNPYDAARLGLSQGKYCRISTGTGFVEAPVELSTDISPGVVSLPHGWGHHAQESRMTVAKAHAGINSNILATGEIDPLSGNAVLNGIAIQVVPARDPD
jgi:anaerobic selenocysteine-containing dehydrogenase